MDRDIVRRRCEQFLEAATRKNAQKRVADHLSQIGYAIDTFDLSLCLEAYMTRYAAMPSRFDDALEKMLA